MFAETAEPPRVRRNLPLQIVRLRQVRPLIWIEAVVEPYSGSRIEYMIKCKSQVGRPPEQRPPGSRRGMQRAATVPVRGLFIYYVYVMFIYLFVIYLCAARTN